MELIDATFWNNEIIWILPTPKSLQCSNGRTGQFPLQISVSITQLYGGWGRHNGETSRSGENAVHFINTVEHPDLCRVEHVKGRTRLNPGGLLLRLLIGWKLRVRIIILARYFVVSHGTVEVDELIGLHGAHVTIGRLQAREWHGSFRKYLGSTQLRVTDPSGSQNLTIALTEVLRRDITGLPMSFTNHVT